MCALIALYMVVGAFLFASIEADSQMAEAVVAFNLRRKFARQLWNVTLHTNILEAEIWKQSAERLVMTFQKDIVANIKDGYTGTDPGVRVWTFPSALMYSLTVFTTIGKSAIKSEKSASYRFPDFGIHGWTISQRSARYFFASDNALGSR